MLSIIPQSGNLNSGNVTLTRLIRKFVLEENWGQYEENHSVDVVAGRDDEPRAIKRSRGKNPAMMIATCVLSVILPRGDFCEVAPETGTITCPALVSVTVPYGTFI